MEHSFLNLTKENLDREHLCCVIRSKKPHPGVGPSGHGSESGSMKAMCSANWTPTSFPDRSRTTWIFGYAARWTMHSLKSFWTTPTPLPSFPRMQGAASSRGTKRYSKAACSTKGSSKTGDSSHGKDRKVNDYGTEISYHAVEALSRILLLEIQAFFESEKGKREFSEWKAQREKGNSKHK